MNYVYRDVHVDKMESMIIVLINRSMKLNIITSVDELIVVRNHRSALHN